MRTTAAFTVEVVEHSVTATRGDVQYGRTVLAKTFTGGLTGESTLEMTTVVGAHGRGYVAVEHITGRLDGREGSFALLHSATDDGIRQSATWTIVPGSGQGALAGIRGEATIDSAAHDVRFDYRFEPTLG